MIDNKRFIRIGSLGGLQAGWWEMSCPKNLLSYSFIIKGKVGRGKEFLCPSWVDVMLPSSVSPPGWAEEFSCPSMVKLGPQIIVFMCAESMSQGSLNYWAHCPGCGSHATIVLLFWVLREMATHSSVLAWRIPGMEEPGGLPSMGSHGVGHSLCFCCMVLLLSKPAWFCG